LEGIEGDKKEESGFTPQKLVRGIFSLVFFFGVAQFLFTGGSSMDPNDGR
jgi:hypothetical protein